MICITRFKGVFLIGLKNYPRRCGENSESVAAASSGFGSSPRVRGTLKTALRELAGVGLIPAGAGNMRSGTPVPTARRAHPRGCGEHIGFLNIYPDFWGSSPRVRGTCKVIILETYSPGLIPAGEGFQG